MIIGCFGHQRSGKTALAVMIARYFQEKFNCKIYTNIDGKDFVVIDKISDIPVDGKTKVVIFDEAYFYLDSRNFKNNQEFSIFLSTLGKQKILLILTAITPDTIEKRLRNQMKYVFLARGDKQKMEYLMLDVLRQGVSPIFIKQKTTDLWDKLSYNSNLVVPNFIECNIKEFIQNAKGSVS